MLVSLILDSGPDFRVKLDGRVYPVAQVRFASISCWKSRHGSRLRVAAVVSHCVIKVNGNKMLKIADRTVVGPALERVNA